MNHFANDKELLKNYNDVWNKISKLLEKGFNCEPVYNDKYIKTNIKIYNNKIYTNLQYNKILKDNEYCTHLSVTLFTVKTDNDHYQTNIF